MTTKHHKPILPILLATTIIVLAGTTGAWAATAPVKEIISSHWGAKVNQTTGGNICTVASGNTCQLGITSSIPGGFSYPEDVAVAPNGDVYGVDTVNHRLQEFEADGTFVRMFGMEVNETAHLDHEVANEDVCPVKPADKCKAGVAGYAPGQFELPLSVVVDPKNGDIYVEERAILFWAFRVQEFTAAGDFVLEIGREVNETTKGNLCTAEEVKAAVAKCKAPAPSEGNSGHGVFTSLLSSGVLPLAIAPNPAEPAEELLYVGDEGGVQEFDTSGVYKREISLTSIAIGPDAAVTALAVNTVGDVYLVYQNGAPPPARVIREFNPTGEEIKQFPLGPREPIVWHFEITALAITQSGRLGVAETETVTRELPKISEFVSFGSLLDPGTGRVITEFTVNRGYEGEKAITEPISGMAFGASDELYAAANQEVIAYAASPVGEPLTDTVVCEPGVEVSTSVTVECSLAGEVDPWGVKETEAWFQWGRTSAFGFETAKQSLANTKSNPGDEEAPLVKVSAPVVGLRPNETFDYRLAAHDHNVKAPEILSSETALFMTPAVAPWVGDVEAPFVRTTSGVLLGELNPENASTNYGFQYAAYAPGSCETLDACSGMIQTPTRQSAQYGKLGASTEATGLQPATHYLYRLVANSENSAKTEKFETKGTENSFTTGPAVTVEALTGPPSSVTATSALISGTVNPDGEPAVYTFELGVYDSADTSYGIVASGSTGAGVIPVDETLALAGLQPGTTYAYRIAIASGYGQARGQTGTFTTLGAPAVLPLTPSLALLAVPAIAFPKEAAVKVTPKTLTRAQKLANALKACAKKPKARRANCKRAAHKAYPTTSKTKKGSKKK